MRLVFRWETFGREVYLQVVIRKRGWPTVIKTFRTKRDAEDWARRTEDEMVRGVHRPRRCRTPA